MCFECIGTKHNILVISILSMHFSRCEIISEVHISLKKFSMNIERLFSGQTELKKCIWKCDMLCWLCQLGRRTGGARRGEVWSCENPLIPVAAAAELQSSPAPRSGLRADEALNICEVCHVPPPVLLPSSHVDHLYNNSIWWSEYVWCLSRHKWWRHILLG